MSDCAHHLTFTIENVINWDDAEARAAQVIRTYTGQNRRGPGATTDEEVLRDAVFHLTEAEDGWTAQVEVTV